MDSEVINATTKWKINTDPENFEKAKKDEAFWALVTLGRAVNALLFVNQAFIDRKGEDSPATPRAGFNQTLFAAALLFESRRLLKTLGKHFSEVPEFRTLSDIFKRKPVRKLLDSDTARLRNKLVFHFDSQEIGRQLRELPPSEETVFMSAMGKTNGQVHWEIADLCAFNSLYEGAWRGSEDPAALAEITRMLGALIFDFTNAAQYLIVKVLSTSGWYKEVL
ncbi:MAG: hypothetical protein WB919_09485 [Candidatus Sulfotelmatobacter sp.]